MGKKVPGHKYRRKTKFLGGSRRLVIEEQWLKWSKRRYREEELLFRDWQRRFNGSRKDWAAELRLLCRGLGYSWNDSIWIKRLSHLNKKEVYQFRMLLRDGTLEKDKAIFNSQVRMGLRSENPLK